MSPEAPPNPSASDIRLVVDEFYGALIAKDVERLSALIDEEFLEDARLRRPESLPGGGTIDGREQIKRFLGAVASMDDGPLDLARMEVTEVLEVPLERVDHAFVSLRFTWSGVATEALERWTFRDLRVAELRSFYWDTATMVGAER